MKAITITRKVDQEISIGDDILITVVEIIGSTKVRLGISAPPDVNVFRKELAERPGSE